MKYLPVVYNGIVIFELPPHSCLKERGVGILDGMRQRSDGHAWTKIAIMNISNPNSNLHLSISSV